MLVDRTNIKAGLCSVLETLRENIIPSHFQLLKAAVFFVDPSSIFQQALTFSHHITGILTLLLPSLLVRTLVMTCPLPHQIIQDPLPSHGPWMETFTFPFLCSLTVTGSTDVCRWPMFCPPSGKIRCFKEVLSKFFILL